MLILKDWHRKIISCKVEFTCSAQKTQKKPPPKNHQVHCLWWITLWILRICHPGCHRPIVISLIINLCNASTGYDFWEKIHLEFAVFWNPSLHKYKCLDSCCDSAESLSRFKMDYIMDYMGACYSWSCNWRSMSKTSVDHLKVQVWLWKHDIPSFFSCWCIQNRNNQLKESFLGRKLLSVLFTTSATELRGDVFMGRRLWNT